MRISQNMTFYRSLAFKNAIIYLLIFLTGLGIMGYLLLDNSSKRIIQTAENQLLHSGDLVEVQLAEYIDGLISDLDFLSNNPVLLKFLKIGNDDNYELLTNEFLTLIESNNDFSQIRFLDAENGIEIVRVDQKNGVSEIISKPNLQNKKDRAYFINSLKLDPTDIYISPINLNREFGEISLPYTPTLRVARPIIIKGALVGVIVINTDLSNLFSKLENSVGSNFNLRIVNEDGYYLLHENKDSTFVFEFDKKRQQVGEDLRTKDNKLIKHSNELISIHRTRNEYLKYDLIYHIIANRSQLLRPYYQWRNTSIFLIFTIASVFSVLAFLLLRRQSKNLKRLTNNMRQFPERRKVSELPVHRNDEIGDLARGFEEMAKIINVQIESIELEKHKAEKAEKEKSIFIENISHEIRNPLQSIIGLSNILEKNKLNPNQVDILKSIKFNTSNLHALVNSILDYQNVINGNALVEKQWTDINELIQELTTGIIYAAEQKSIDIQVHVDNKLNTVEVEIDRLRVTQILSNLISNAITHTASNGKIEIRIDSKQEADDHTKLLFTVTDNGVGMTSAELDRIKERYFTKSKEQELHTNFGLGLTIVHELLGLMNTQLKIESIKDKGSIFSFEIEAITKEKSVDTVQDKGLDTTFNNLKILIIEDDKQIRAVYQHYFKGYQMQCVQSFAELKNCTETFDIIISDFNLADTNLIAQKDVLSSISTPQTSLIVISGTRPDLTILSESFPELMFAQKPVRKDSLFQIISIGRVCLTYGKPVLDNIKKDYDYDPSKYARAIILLLDEWKIYMRRLLKGISENDSEEIEEILHKFNNTLRKLKLDKFEKHLISLKTDILANTQNNEEWSKEIQKIMSHYYAYIKSSIN